MTKQPEALRVADVLAGSPNYSGTPIWEAVDLLRRQHEAIVKLREALTELKAHAGQIDSKVGYLSTTRKHEVGRIYNLAANALKDTEDLE